MNHSKFYYCCFLISALFLFSSCDKDTIQTDEQQALAQLFSAIKMMAENSTCGENEELKYIAIGAKACGGATGYLAYSSSINVSTFESMVANYTEMQRNYNRKWSVISDCSLVGQPKSVTCENGKPKLVY